MEIERIEPPPPTPWVGVSRIHYRTAPATTSYRLTLSERELVTLRAVLVLGGAEDIVSGMYRQISDMLQGSQ